MKKTRLIILTISFYTGLSANSSLSYSGTSGLFEIPNARIQKDYGATFFASYDKPYSHYGVSTAIFPYIELNTHLTQLKKSVSSDKRDKIVSLKVLLYPESDFTPSIAYGMDDIWGNANYSSKYLVLSKRVKYLDFTLGYAVGRLGGSDSYVTNTKSSFNYIKDSSLNDGGFFGGVEFYATKKLRLLAEGNSIKYHNDKKNPFGDKKEDFHFNFGAKYDITDNLSSQMSLQRGDTFSFALNYTIPLFNKYKKRDKTIYTHDLYKNLEESGFSNIKLSKNNKSLWLKAHNKTTYYDLVTLSKATKSVYKSKDSKLYDYVYLDLNNANKKVFKISTKEFEKYEDEEVSNTYMKKALIVDNNKDKLYKEFKNRKENIKSKYFDVKKFYYDFSAKTRTYLFNEEDPIVNKTTLELSSSFKLLSNLDANSNISIPIYNSMNHIDKTSVYDRYKNPYLDKLYLSYYSIFNNNYINIDAGFLNQKYSGLNLEYQKSLFDDKFAFSLQYQSVLPRYEDDIFKTYSNSKDAKFINLYYQLSKEKNTHLGLRAGEFLDGDRGYRFDLARSYGSFVFGAYLSRTKDEEYENNKGFYVKMYLDKGIFSTKQKPINIDFDSHSKESDFVDFDNSLFNRLSNENNLQLIKKNIYLLK